MVLDRGRGSAGWRTVLQEGGGLMWDGRRGGVNELMGGCEWYPGKWLIEYEGIIARETHFSQELGGFRSRSLLLSRD